MRSLTNSPLALAVVLLLGCGFLPEKVSLSDPRLAPMLEAIAAVDREALGFTPIPTNADIRLESRPRVGYDAMLHIYANTSRTIAFRRTSNGYKWIAEQEIYHGPKKFRTPDGDVQEQVVIEYQTERLNGIPLNRIHVGHWGEDPRLAHRRDLTLADVRPVLAEWKKK